MGYQKLGPVVNHVKKCVKRVSKYFKVEVHEIEHETLSTKHVWPRGNIVDLLERGASIVTIRPEESEGYRTLKRVNLVRRNGTSHMRIDDDIIPIDDLGDIPDI